jgi:hypothetical protein
MPPSYSCDDFEIAYYANLKVKLSGLLSLMQETRPFELTFVQRQAVKEVYVAKIDNDFDVLEFNNELCESGKSGK